MSKYGLIYNKSMIYVSGYTPLHEACKQGQLYIIRSLVKESEDYIDLVDKNNMTPLHYAALFNKKKAYNFLIEQGANDQCYDNLGRTPEFILNQCSDEIDLLGDCGNCCIIL